MKPIALLSVDAERENLHVQKLNKKMPPKPTVAAKGSHKNITRSRSLHSISGRCVNSLKR